MSDNGKTLGPGSRILRERAMNILRETRAKIDPQLLAHMKERLSKAMPPNGMAPPPQSPPATGAAEVPPPRKETVFKPEPPRGTVPPVPEPEKKPPASSASGPEMEPVDRQKIAQIVLEYMKQRQETQKH